MFKKRNRFRPAESFEVRLQRFADDTRAAALAMPSGDEREALLRKVERTENALKIKSALSFGRFEGGERIRGRE